MTEKKRIDKWFLNGGRGSGQAYRRLFEYYENKVYALNEKIAELKEENKNLSDNYELYKATAEPTIKELKEQIENLKIMLQAEREVRCNDEYLKKVTELETYNEKLLNGDIEKHNKIVSLEAQIEKMKMDKCKLTSEIKRLSIQYAEETDEIVKQLETQIEKMKCCANCKHSRTEYEHCRTDKHEKWEMQ